MPQNSNCSNPEHMQARSRLSLYLVAGESAYTVSLACCAPFEELSNTFTALILFESV